MRMGVWLFDHPFRSRHRVHGEGIFIPGPETTPVESVADSRFAAVSWCPYFGLYMCFKLISETNMVSIRRNAEFDWILPPIAGSNKKISLCPLCLCGEFIPHSSFAFLRSGNKYRHLFSRGRSTCCRTHMWPCWDLRISIGWPDPVHGSKGGTWKYSRRFPL